MASLQREREAKVALLEALVRSQQAVARMLESTADLYCAGPAGPGSGSEQLARLAALQYAMAGQLRGIRLRELRHGNAARPWLAAGVRAGTGGDEPADDMTGRDRI